MPSQKEVTILTMQPIWCLFVTTWLYVATLCLGFHIDLKPRLSLTTAVASSRSSSSSSPVSRREQPRKQPLLTKLDVSRVKIGGLRWIIPGDYVVHEEYGVGKYVGIRMVDLTPARGVRTLQPVVVVQYADGEISIFQRIVEKELWLFRSADSGDQELGTLIDRRKWKRRKANVEQASQTMALSLSKMMAIRNGFHRTPCASDDDRYMTFENQFSFEPTEDQATCFRTVASDMINNTRPMDRLICGDVGFGKTEVAMRAIYRAVLSKKQVALLAPTRVLATQHLRVLRNRMPDVNVQQLRGGGKSDALKVKEQLKTGECQVVVGTHALLQPTVSFGNLGLLIIDEEQRFGVAHKEKLKAVSSGTDVLTLSATPIPRTLQMSLSGLRDLSLMNSPPKGRREVNVTVCMDDTEVMRTAIENEVDRGGQVFVVVPFVRDVCTVTARLKEIIDGLRVIEAHGQHDDLEDRIDAFSAGEADVLVATTVIENGVDMPNVNTILVLSADRFGMSALYQLRGRVGRSPKQAYAYFMTNTTSITIEAESRLKHIETFTALGSGYDLSRRDMEMRGFGTIFGSDQSGAADVGLDLQASILASAISRLNQEHILSVSETRVALGGVLEDFAVNNNVGTLPQASDLTAVSRWEASLAERLLDVMTPKGSKTFRKANALRSYFAAGSESALEHLLDEWRLALKAEFPLLFERLVRRSQCRVLCRRLGITEVRLVDGKHAFFLSSAIDKKKWKAMSAVIPESLAPRVSFDVRSFSSGTASSPATLGVDGDGTTEEGEKGTTGIIRLMDATVDEENGDAVEVEGAIMQLLRPLVAYADDLLDKAVADCDPAKDAASEGAPKAGKDEGVGADAAAKTRTRAPRKRKLD